MSSILNLSRPKALEITPFELKPIKHDIGSKGVMFCPNISNRRLSLQTQTNSSTKYKGEETAQACLMNQLTSPWSHIQAKTPSSDKVHSLFSDFIPSNTVSVEQFANIPQSYPLYKYIYIYI